MAVSPELLLDADLQAYYERLPPSARKAVDALPPDRRAAALKIGLTVKGDAAKSVTLNHNRALSVDVVDHIESIYYVPETRLPMRLEEHQKVILRMAFDPRFRFQTVVYSTIKKSGKTAVTAAVARWVAETWGWGNEIYMVANDAEQARGRQYASFLTSLELTPGWQSQRRQLTGPSAIHPSSPVLWQVVEREARFVPNSSIIRALSGDYRGEAGGNPTGVFFSELWGFASEKAHRLYDELTSVPTRARSIKWIETYAGFEDESDLLLSVYRSGVKEGRRLTRDDLAKYGYSWPFDEKRDPELPLYINETERLFMYWDQTLEGEGLGARRMPWQIGSDADAYYATQAATLRPETYRRLHQNLWTTNTASFLPIEWYDQCYDPMAASFDHEHTPLVIAVDGAVTSDCCAVVAVSRDEKDAKNVIERFSRIWTPPRGGFINLREVEDYLVECVEKYNVVSIVYDPFQLSKLMQDLKARVDVWCKSFNQGAPRAVADKLLYDLYRDRRLRHPNGPRTEQRQHVMNAGAQVSDKEDSKMRLVKKSRDGKIDYTVSASMACAECLRLLLD